MGTTAPVTVADWLDRQLQLHPADIELGLDRVRVVAARLGIERAARRQLVVAGTNGKGSSVAVLEALGRAHGWTTATYTSPHLVHYNERIRFDGEPVDDASLCAAFERVDAARGEVPLTYFEFGTLAALDLIRRAAVDLAVLEIGLGGRLDAVNIIDGDGALVTAIGLDHMEYLGPDRAAIGREKAGVFRAGQPAVCADVDAPATIAAVATEVGAAYRERGQDFDVGYGADGWVLNLGSVALDGLPWPVAGAQHAVDNAAGALALMDALGWLPGREAIDAAITARPGRQAAGPGSGAAPGGRRRSQSRGGGGDLSLARRAGVRRPGARRSGHACRQGSGGLRRGPRG
ncbi:MAG: bifunctional folylpolyglutamate synthase/dihydrofolate synthase [Pseudomonadota bacterium]